MTVCHASHLVLAADCSRRQFDEKVLPPFLNPIDPCKNAQRKAYDSSESGALEPGKDQRLLLDDGKIRMKAV